MFDEAIAEREKTVQLNRNRKRAQVSLLAIYDKLGNTEGKFLRKIAY